MELQDLERTQARKDEVNWITAGFMAAFHVGAVAALFFFTWKALLVAIFLWWVSGSLGIGMAYHRLLTHRGYKTPKWVEYFLTVCATLALEGGPIFWVATHRIHHQFSDHEGDPHSPIDGKWWAHMGWILMGKSMHHDTTTLARYVPDLAKDKFHVWITKYHYVPQIILGRHSVCHRRPAMAAVGNVLAHSVRAARDLAGEFGDAFVGNAPLCDARPVHQQLVGGFADLRRRLAQQSPRASDVGAHGLTWYEIDTNWYGIWILKKLGLAWDIQRVTLADVEQGRVAAPNGRLIAPELAASGD